jgi:hypothetical protein
MSTHCIVSGWSSHGTRVLLTIPSIIVIYFIAFLYNCKAIREFKLRVIRYTLYVKRQTPGKEKFYGIKQRRVNELAVLKLKYIIILSTQERKYETKVRTCRLPFPET